MFSISCRNDATGKANSLAEAATKFVEAGKIDGDPNLSDPGRSFPLSEAALHGPSS